ncbi:MAG: hypothetical protein WEB63_06450 [Cucumibacter sp.]
MALEHAADPPATRLPPQFGQTVAGIFIVIAVLGLAAAYALQAMTGSAGDGLPAAPGEPVKFTLAAAELTVPANWLDGQRGGFVEAIEMTLPLALPGVPERLAVEVTLLSRNRAIPSAALLDRLYIHRFSVEQISGPRGLIGKPLLAEAGYQNETVWYDPVSGNPFVAKCLEIADGIGRRLECMRIVPLGQKVSAVVRFDGQALERWQEFDAAVEATLAGLF